MTVEEARNEAISVVEGWQTEKREIAAMRSHSTVCHREERSDLACSGFANSEKRDCHAALAMTTEVTARYMAISVVQGSQAEKREIVSQARNPQRGL